MKILFISAELIGSAVVNKIVKEGHDVKLFIEHEDRRNCLDGIVEKTSDWEAELAWVGTDGLIIFDDIVFNGAQDKLREAGYSVFGGNLESDKLELNRQFFQEKLAEHGLQTLPSHHFEQVDDAIDFVQKNPDYWVLKQNSHIGMLNHVGQKSDGSDILEMLEIYKQKKLTHIQIQKRALGVEIGIGRQFNGSEWVGPMKINFEHKPLCNDDLGPLTAEMGTLVWCSDDESQQIYQRTLAKFESYLKEISYRGDFDINCIANEEGIWPLEATMRFGTPSTEAHVELYQDTNWGELLKAVADGKDYAVEYSDSYGLVVSAAVPPFPYAPERFKDSEIITCTGASVSFIEKLSPKEMNQIHFEEVACDEQNGEKHYYLAGKHGYVLYVTGQGDTVEKAQRDCYTTLKKIYIPKMFYRTDIGQRFIAHEQQDLINWGYLKEHN